MKIVTFNILHCMNYRTKRIDFEGFANEIKGFDADIIGLNEVRGSGPVKDYTDQLKKLSELTALNYYFGKAILVGGTSPYGNGILAKASVNNAVTLPIPDPAVRTGTEGYETRCIIKAEINDYTVIVTHMGLNRDERENAVREILKASPDRRCIIMGDFNCTPDSPELQPLTEKYCCADKNTLTFPSDKPRIKIDYILTSPDIRIKSFGTSAASVSDHLAHFIEIED